MSRKSSNSHSKAADNDIQAADPDSRDRPRERLQTWRGFKYALDNKVAAFDKDTKALLRAVEEAREKVQEENSNVEQTHITLQVTIRGYRSSFQDLEILFTNDRWGECDSIAPKIRDLASNAIKCAENQLAELLPKNPTKMTEPIISRTHDNEPTPSTKTTSKRSSRSSRSSLLATKLKTMADAAAEKEQAEFDLVIAEKENEIKLHEAAEKQRSLALKAQRDHEMAVLKAQQRAAMATAKISAIEQSLSEEKMSMRDPRSNDGDEERVRQWVKDQEHNLDPKPSHLREINPGAYKTSEIGRPTYLAADIEHLPYLDPRLGLNPRARVGRPDDDPITVQGCMLAIAETNRQLSACLASQNLPKCHPDVFSGDFAMFHAWKKAFQAMIYDAEISPEQEINYLHKYTSGEPQKLIDNYRKRIDDNQFKVIKELWSEMERRFGNVAAITNALLQRLEDASRFGEKDAKKLQEFSDLCDNVSDQMKQLPGLKCLNFPNVIRPLVMKLPGHLQRKWDERVVEFASTNYDLYPDFEVFAREVRKTR